MKKNRLFEIMSVLDKTFNINEAAEISEIPEILSGYIQAALFTEEERLNDERNSEPDLYNDPDEDSDNELEKLIMIAGNYKKKIMAGIFKTRYRTKLTNKSIWRY